MMVGRRNHRRLIFDGNSLANFSGGNVFYGQRYPLTCYNSLTQTQPLAYFNYSKGSERTATRTMNFPGQIGPMVRPNDIVVFWEICNEAHDYTEDDNGDILYAHIVTYCNLVRSYGAKIIVLTGIARDMEGYDDADISSRIFACNAQIRSSWTSFCDGVADVGALSMFDQKTDTTNTTYYHTDQTHLTNTGYDTIASTVATVVQTFL